MRLTLVLWFSFWPLLSRYTVPLKLLQKGDGDYYRWKESYTYGAGGERISMTYLPAYDANNGWDPHDGTAGAEKGVAPRTLWYLNDALGSAVGLIKKDGRVSSRYHYDEFGIPTDAKKFDVNWPGPDNLIGYTGLGYAYNSGLTYARARYYQPEIGRFISEDTYKGDMWKPHTQNLYGYVHNNPINWIDPSGNVEIQDLLYLSPDNYIEVLRKTKINNDALDGVYSAVEECYTGECFIVDETEYWKARAHREAEAIRDQNLIEMADSVDEAFRQWALQQLLNEATDGMFDKIIAQINPFHIDTAYAGGSGKGKYKDVGGHHIHAKAGFDGHVTYSSREGFAISHEYMKQRNWNHD